MESLPGNEAGESCKAAKVCNYSIQRLWGMKGKVSALKNTLYEVYHIQFFGVLLRAVLAKLCLNQKRTKQF